MTTRDRIVVQPFLFRVRPSGWRHAVVPRFPSYAIFYKETEVCWLIAAIVSTAQDPDSILAKLLIREAREESI